MTDIDYLSPALGPVRERITAQIGEYTKKCVNPSIPLDEVPTYRGGIVALVWLLEQLEKPKEVIQ